MPVYKHGCYCYIPLYPTVINNKRLPCCLICNRRRSQTRLLDWFRPAPFSHTKNASQTAFIEVTLHSVTHRQSHLITFRVGSHQAEGRAHRQSRADRHTDSHSHLGETSNTSSSPEQHVLGRQNVQTPHRKTSVAPTKTLTVGIIRRRWKDLGPYFSDP